MRQVRLAWVVSLAFAACSNGNNGSSTPDMSPAPTTGGIAGVATLDGMTSGDSGTIVGVLGGSLAYTDDAGKWAIGNLPPGPVTLQASHAGYMPAMATVTVVAGTVTTAPPMNLTKIPTTPMGGLSGHVFLFDTSAAAGSTVTLSPGSATAMSAADGSWSIANLAAGVYSVTFAHAGYVSQTVANVIVPDSGAIAMADVTLKRNTTIIDGHQIDELGSSPDQSLQLLAIDHALEVVSESTGTAVPVGVGTAANNGGLAADDKHLWLSDGNGLLWVGTTDGRSLSLLSGTFNGNIILSQDGSHLLFQATDALGDTNFYIASTSGGTPTLVVDQAALSGALAGGFSLNTMTGVAFFLPTSLDANNNTVADAIFLDMNSGTMTTVADVAVNTRLNLLSFTPSYLVFTTSLGTQPSTTTSIGDLYIWKPGAPPKKLSGGTGPLPDGGVPINPQYTADFLGQPQLVWANVSNFDSDNTTMLVAIDANAGAVRPIVGHTTFPGPFAGGIPFGAQLPPPTGFFQKILALDLHDNTGTYTFDVVSIDFFAGTATMVQADAARLMDGAAAANDFIFSYARPNFGGPTPDLSHFLVGNSRSSTSAQSTMNWTLYDGTLHKLNDPASPISTDTFFSFSSDYRVCLYATPYGPPTPSATPLTIVNLPATGTAGDGVPVPLSADYYPPGGTFNSALSADHSTVAFFTISGGTPTSTLYKVATAASATAVTPTQLLAADPNAAGNLTWVAISGKGDLVFTGDQGGSGANTWVVTTDGTATELDAGGLGTSRPGVFALADGKRTFVTDETAGGNFLVQVDTAATPALTRIDSYTTGSSRLNATATRYFWQGSAGPELDWATSSATGSVAGTWNVVPVGPPIGLPPDATTYFISGPLLTAFDAATGVVPLATNQLVTLPFPAYTWDGKALMLVDQDAGGVNHLIVSPTAAPARLVLADGYASTSPPVTSSTTTQDGFWSTDFSTMYAWGDANAGSGNPPSWTLRAFVPGSAAIGTLGTNILHDNSATFGATQKYLFFRGLDDPLLGTASYYASSVGSAAAVTQTENARSVSRSITDAAAFAVLLPDGTSHVAAAAPGAAATAFSGAASTNAGFLWSLDGKRLFVSDDGLGNGFATAWAGVPGAAGAIYDTDVIEGLMPDGTGQNLLTVALHGNDGFLSVDHAAIP